MPAKLLRAFPESEIMKVTNTTGSTITAGSFIPFAGGVAFVLYDIPDTETGTIYTRGAFTSAPKTTGQAWTRGDKLYLTAGGVWTTTVGSNALGAIADEDAASGDTVGKVKLLEQPGS